MQAFHLYQDFANVFALSHEPECRFYVVSIKHSCLQWLHRAILDAILHQIVNGLPVRISRLNQRIQEDAVE